MRICCRGFSVFGQWSKKWQSSNCDVFECHSTEPMSLDAGLLMWLGLRLLRAFTQHLAYGTGLPHSDDWWLADCVLELSAFHLCIFLILFFLSHCVSNQIMPGLFTVAELKSNVTASENHLSNKVCACYCCSVTTLHQRGCLHCGRLWCLNTLCEELHLANGPSSSQMHFTALDKVDLHITLLNM